ncbi:uncharacterized protein LOC116851144 [Odontomachus brunneus]|uniref:uncharacterized protein LOC116851144 n=1 Tax=Odontomachus brunneus TaxID=486640 RepID=UPI0013F20EF7|nr:uncharacterized protein LOC116851144 [Odontomachus brunneus]
MPKWERTFHQHSVGEALKYGIPLTSSAIIHRRRQLARVGLIPGADTELAVSLTREITDEVHGRLHRSVHGPSFRARCSETRRDDARAGGRKILTQRDPREKERGSEGRDWIFITSGKRARVQPLDRLDRTRRS